jgi:hypothetical protein
MQLKPVVQGLAVVWLLLFLMSFVALEATPSDGSYTGMLNRVAQFLTWQVLALGVAAVGAFAARVAAQRGVEGVNLFGYWPLAVSLFVVVLFISLVALRVLVPALLFGE